MFVKGGGNMREFKGYKKGVNLGGWLSQCEHGYEHYDTFITEADLKKISGWGLDHIRLPIDYQLVRDNDGNDIEKGYLYINHCLEWCEKYGFNMILDLHKTAGFSFDVETNDFFGSEILQDKFVALWEELAKRYGKYCDRLVFELLNHLGFFAFGNIVKIGINLWLFTFQQIDLGQPCLIKNRHGRMVSHSL